MAVITYRVAGNIQINEQVIIDAIAAKAEVRLAELGERVAKVASARAPVGRDTPTSARSFQPAHLRAESQFENDPGYEKFIINPKTHALRTRADLIRNLKKAGPTRDPNITRFFRGTRKRGTLKESPTELRVKGNTIVGAFQHRPGRLKASIKFVGVKRRGNTVTATVRAHAPYAMAVHEGFKHTGGWAKKSGKETKVAGQPFLRNALVNIRGDLNNPRAFEG